MPETRSIPAASDLPPYEPQQILAAPFSPMRAVQPWPTGEYAEALLRGRSGGSA
jgi:hypothetical protein